MNAIEQILRRGPTTVEDAKADVLLLDAALDHVLLVGDAVEELDTLWDQFTAAWKRLEALASQIPQRHPGAWAVIQHGDVL